MSVPKKDGPLRVWVDSGKINAVKTRDSYRHSGMDECINNPGEAKVFSMLDANSGYQKTRIDGRDRHKTAFTSHHVLYRLTTRPIGLMSALETFPRAMNVFLAYLR